MNKKDKKLLKFLYNVINSPRCLSSLDKHELIAKRHFSEKSLKKLYKKGLANKETVTKERIYITQKGYDYINGKL